MDRSTFFIAGAMLAATPFLFSKQAKVLGRRLLILPLMTSKKAHIMIRCISNLAIALFTACSLGHYRKFAKKIRAEQFTHNQSTLFTCIGEAINGTLPFSILQAQITYMKNQSGDKTVADMINRVNFNEKKLQGFYHECLLQQALASGNLDVARLLIENGAELHAISNYYFTLSKKAQRATPLETVLMMPNIPNRFEVVQFFVQQLHAKDSNINAGEHLARRDNAPILYVAIKSLADMAERLGKDHPDFKNFEKELLPIIAYLIEQGASVNVEGGVHTKNHDLGSPKYSLLKSISLDWCKIYNLNLKTIKGPSRKDYAEVLSEYFKIRDLMLKKGATLLEGEEYPEAIKFVLRATEEKVKKTRALRS